MGSYKIDREKGISEAADCQHNEGDHQHRTVDIYRPSPWGQCMEKNGERVQRCGTGTRHREVACAFDQDLCETYGSDIYPETTEQCTDRSGCDASGAISSTPRSSTMLALFPVLGAVL